MTNTNSDTKTSETPTEEVKIGVSIQEIGNSEFLLTNDIGDATPLPPQKKKTTRRKKKEVPKEENFVGGQVAAIDQPRLAGEKKGVLEIANLQEQAELDKQKLTGASQVQGADPNFSYAKKTWNKFFKSLTLALIASSIPIIWGILSVLDTQVAWVLTSSIFVALLVMYDTIGKQWAVRLWE